MAEPLSHPPHDLLIHSWSGIEVAGSRHHDHPTPLPARLASNRGTSRLRPDVDFRTPHSSQNRPPRSWGRLLSVAVTESAPGATSRESPGTAQTMTKMCTGSRIWSGVRVDTQHEAAETGFSELAHLRPTRVDHRPSKVGGRAVGGLSARSDDSDNAPSEPWYAGAVDLSADR